MSVRCREGPAAHSVWFPHFLPHGGKHLQEGLQLFFFSFFLFIKPITFPFFWWYTAWSGMFSFLSSPFFAFWMCRSVWSDRNTFFVFFLLTYRNKNPYTGIIVICCCCCFSCLLFLLCIDNFTDCHFLFYVCFFFLVSFSWIWRQVGVCVNLLLGFKSTCTQTNKHTNQPVKKKVLDISQALLFKDSWVFITFSFMWYIHLMAVGCWTVAKGMVYYDRTRISTAPPSCPQLSFFPPLFLCAWFLLLFASLPEPVESSQNHLRNHFFAVPSRIIRTSGFHMED